jgi:hypothetical protein
VSLDLWPWLDSVRCEALVAVPAAPESLVHSFDHHSNSDNNFRK